jgi:Undecaprenyl-phosphate glucose phosphotransferase
LAATPRRRPADPQRRTTWDRFAQGRATPVLKQRQQLFVALLALADALVIIAACLCAWSLRRHQIDGNLPALVWPAGVREWIQQPLLIFAIPIALTSLRVFGLYRPWRDKRMLAEARAILNASIATIISLIVLLWGLGPDIMGGSDPSRMATYFGVRFDAAKLQLVCLAVLLPAFLTVQRAAFRAMLRELRRRGKNLRHVAIIGTGRLARIACRTLDRNAWTGLHVAYFVAHHEPDKAGEHGAPAPILNRPVLGSIQDLEAILDRRPVDAVYLAIPNTRAALLPQLLRRLEKFPLDVRIIPDVSPRYTPLSMTINELEGMPILSIRENPMAGVAGIVKRSIDVVGSILALALFGAPMLVIAGLVKLSSPGPAIFRQRRVSLGGEEFNILKFRTMRQAADEQSTSAHPLGWTAKNDPRVTPIGRILRGTSLDELPQLFNVLLGDMSLVGPRPERPELIAKFREDWRGYMLRQHVKAGMTGWAQINGHRGDTGLRKRLQHDLFYIRHWSLAFDLKILWLTLFRGFVHRNAH